MKKYNSACSSLRPGQLDKLVAGVKDCRPLDKQVGGDYYKNMAVQPYIFFFNNKVPHHKAAIIRRIHRYDLPGGQGMKDLNKILHELELIFELETWNKYIFRNEEIPMAVFIQKNKIPAEKAEVIRLIYDYDSLDGNGKYDLKRIRTIIEKLKMVLEHNRRIQHDNKLDGGNCKPVQ